jgi:hypothetical protein
MSLSAGAEPPHFPMRVSEFLKDADRHLDRGDIILTRNKTWGSRIVHFGTGSFFTHAALVFLLPSPAEHFENTFVLESMPSGVGVANIKRWISGPNPTEEIAILRLQGHGLDRAYFKQVGGIMLDQVNSAYDYGIAVNLGLSVWFGIKLGWSRIAKRTTAYKPWTPKTFICSGYIQYGLVEAKRRNNLDPDSVLLKEGVASYDRAGLLAVSPNDIAHSKKLKWLYAVRRGWVHQVNSYEQAREVISGARS